MRCEAVKITLATADYVVFNDANHLESRGGWKLTGLLGFERLTGV